MNPGFHVQHHVRTENLVSPARLAPSGIRSEVGRTAILKDEGGQETRDLIGLMEDMVRVFRHAPNKVSRNCNINRTPKVCKVK